MQTDSQTTKDVIEVQEPGGVGLGAPFNALDGPESTALRLAIKTWEQKRLGKNMPLQMTVILQSESPEEMADQLEYIAHSLRANGWSAGSGGGKGIFMVWEMFCEPNDRGEQQ